jgi:RNase H-like domain found in reverse transcriptase
MKRFIAKETLLTYPNFNKTFLIHKDISKVQLGACILHKERLVAFYSRKLNPSQTRYTTTEKEFLSIIETLKEFRNIFRIANYANLTYQHFTSLTDL